MSLFCRQRTEKKFVLKCFLDCIAFLAQVTGIWFISNQSMMGAVSLILISFGWWQNFVADKDSQIKFVQFLGQVKGRIQNSKKFTFTFVSILKILTFFTCMIFMVHVNDNSMESLFSRFSEAFNVHPLNVTETSPLVESKMMDELDLKLFDGHVFLREVIKVMSSSTFPLVVLAVHIVSSYLVFYLGKQSCKILIQMIG